MKNTKFLPLIFLLAILSVPKVASAYVYDISILPEWSENGLELINLFLAVLAATFSIKLAALSQGGQMEKTWNLLAIAAGLFAILEINNALSGFNLVHIGGLSELVEAIFLTIFFTTFYKTRKSLLKQTMSH
ncbi:MAG: hypothetical protein Q7S48_02945 [bacterium]|nr:hypothetical protein [bacterium]